MGPHALYWVQDEKLSHTPPPSILLTNNNDKAQQKLDVSELGYKTPAMVS